MGNLNFDRKKVIKTVEYYKLKYKLSRFDYELVQDLHKEFAIKMNGFVKTALAVYTLAVKNAVVYIDEEDKRDRLERAENALEDLNWVKKMAQINITKE